jgi:hypothetical protein
MTLERRLRLAWMLSIAIGIVVGIVIFFVASRGGAIGDLLFSSLCGAIAYFIAVHLITIVMVPEIIKFIVSDDYEFDLETWKQNTKYVITENSIVDKYMRRYVNARQYSMFALTGLLICAALGLLLLSCVFSGG